MAELGVGEVFPERDNKMTYLNKCPSYTGAMQGVAFPHSHFLYLCVSVTFGEVFFSCSSSVSLF